MILHISVKAQARENSVIEDKLGNYIIKTTAPPEYGKANISVIKLLAKHLNIHERSVHIIHGHKKSKKLIEVL